MIRRALFMISSMRGGGSERQTLMLLKHLDRSQFSPHLYVMERAGDLLCQVPADIPIHSFEDVRKEPMVYLPGGMMRQQIRHLQELLSNESIDVIYDRTFHMTMIAGPASRQLPARRQRRRCRQNPWKHQVRWRNRYCHCSGLSPQWQYAGCRRRQRRPRQ